MACPLRRHSINNHSLYHVQETDPVLIRVFKYLCHLNTARRQMAAILQTTFLPLVPEARRGIVNICIHLSVLPCELACPHNDLRNIIDMFWNLAGELLRWTFNGSLGVSDEFYWISDRWHSGGKCLGKNAGQIQSKYMCIMTQWHHIWCWSLVIWYSRRNYIWCCILVKGAKAVFIIELILLYRNFCVLVHTSFKFVPRDQ